MRRCHDLTVGTDAGVDLYPEKLQLGSSSPSLHRGTNKIVYCPSLGTYSTPGEYDSDDAGRNDDYGGIDTDDDGGRDTDDDGGKDTDDDGGNDTDDDGGIGTDDDDDGDDSGPPFGSNSEPGLQERAALHGRRMTKASRPHTHRSLSLWTQPL
ncbi:hypothetical protein ElyMa_005902100 [Elysia marginata]|uniref:Uncharacterized protein n=1 Tax=Elysia marginata TaxID=1093978 RepID=A0AAV4G5P4_9GAST|nr:hypothetical protein ElyMa_005902100 [Elysia marginata]